MKTNLDAIKNGHMNGSDDDIFEALKTFLDSNSPIIRDYASELWLRGYSKQDFLDWYNKKYGNQT